MALPGGHTAGGVEGVAETREAAEVPTSAAGTAAPATPTPPSGAAVPEADAVGVGASARESAVRQSLKVAGAVGEEQDEAVVMLTAAAAAADNDSRAVDRERSTGGSEGASPLTPPPAVMGVWVQYEDTAVRFRVTGDLTAHDVLLEALRVLAGWSSHWMSPPPMSSPPLPSLAAYCIPAPTSTPCGGYLVDATGTVVPGACRLVHAAASSESVGLFSAAALLSSGAADPAAPTTPRLRLLAGPLPRPTATATAATATGLEVLAVRSLGQSDATTTAAIAGITDRQSNVLPWPPVLADTVYASDDSVTVTEPEDGDGDDGDDDDEDLPGGSRHAHAGLRQRHGPGPPMPPRRHHPSRAADLAADLWRSPLDTHSTHCFACGRRTPRPCLRCSEPSCARTYHPECIGGAPTAATMSSFECPQHRCAVCHARADPTRLLLFACQRCPRAFCALHLPPGYIDLRLGARTTTVRGGCGSVPSGAVPIWCPWCAVPSSATPPAPARVTIMPRPSSRPTERRKRARTVSAAAAAAAASSTRPVRMPPAPPLRPEEEMAGPLLEMRMLDDDKRYVLGPQAGELTNYDEAAGLCKNSFLQAAFLIFREAIVLRCRERPALAPALATKGGRVEMDAREILRLARTRGFYPVESSEPHNTFSSQIYRNMKRKREASAFRKAGRGQFTLAPWALTDILRNEGISISSSSSSSSSNNNNSSSSSTAPSNPHPS